MITLREAASGIHGAWRLALRDPGGLAFFDISRRGFWRSFWAAAICAPPYALVLTLDYAQHPTTASDLRILAVQLIAYCLIWTVYPLAMIWGARLLDREHHYIRFMVARNWTGVPQMFFLLLPELALIALGGDTAVPVALAVTALILVYQWYVARIALEIGGLHAVAVVILELALNLLIMAVASTMIPLDAAPAPPALPASAAD